MTKNTFELSRRKVLGGIGTIGAASAVTGAGTMAFLNDGEETTSNEVQAGTLNLVMDWHYTANQDIARTQTGEGGASKSFNISDVKPGDTGTITVDFKPKSNPAWVWLQMEETADNDGRNTEPEKELPSEIDGDGELDDKMKAVVKDGNGNTLVPEDTLGSVMSSVSDGVLLDHDHSNNSNDYFPANHEGSVVIEWELPASVGNVIQGDVCKLDIGLYAEQARHNANPANPFNSTSTS